MPNRAEIRIGDLVFSTETRDLRDAAGQVDLRNKSSEVLAVLAAHQGKIVSKSDIMEVVWPDVTVSDEGLTQCIADIRRAIGDSGQTIVRTHIGKGYSLAGAPRAKRLAKTPAFAIGIIGALALAVALFWWSNTASPPTAQDKPRIAVLAFDDLSAGEDRGWMSDGIAEGVITELSRYPEFLVIARNSSFSFRDESIDTTQIAKKLDADYIVEGSKQKSGSRLRVTVQFIDAHDGTHIWAHEFDTDIGELFEVQSQIVRSISMGIGRELAFVPPRIGGRTTVNALHLFQQGNDAFRQRTRASRIQAKDLYLKSIEAAPDAPFGHVGMAMTIWADLVSGWVYPDLPRDELLKLGYDYAEKAIHADPEYYAAHISLGDIHAMAGNHADAILSYEKAIELNPSDSVALAAVSDPLLYMNRADEAIAVLERAIDINPITPDWYFNNLSRAYWAVGRCEEGIRTIKRRATMREWDYRALIVNLVCEGRQEEARLASEKLLELSPDFTVSGHGDRVKGIINNPEYLKKWLAALRAGGLPNGKATVGKK